MKKIFLLFFYLHTLTVSFTQGITLLYKGGSSGGWNNPSNWIQLKTPQDQTPIQRVPTELDHVIFSKSMSGISGVLIEPEKEGDSITVGINRTSGIRCRSLRISNTSFETSSPFRNSIPAIFVSTAHGGYVLIDSNSTSLSADFFLEGGDPDIYDLQLLDSKLGEIKAHNLYLGSLSIGPKGRAKFKNSTFGCPMVSGSKTGGEFYAENSTFNSFGLRMGADSKVTLLKCTFTDLNPAVNTLKFIIGPNSHFISDSVQLHPTFSLDLSLSGAVFNGNIKQIYPASGGLRLIQSDTTNPLPTIINGNVEVFAQNLDLSGDLKVSGNFINHATVWDMFPASPDYPDSSRVYINGQEIFKIGGIANYANGTTLTNCTKLGCHFKVEFFGDKDSHVKWPVGFPVDTLVINKTNCGKVTFENPLYVSGETKIQSGQLVLNPNDTIPYKFVNAGNLTISPGGGLFLRRNAAGVAANIAVGGAINDLNTTTDTTCAGFSNPYGGTIGLYKGLQGQPRMPVAIRTNTPIDNLTLHGEAGTEFFLERNLSVKQLRFTGKTKLLLGPHSLTVSDSIANFSPANFVVTNGAGKLRLNNIRNKEIVFPVGPSATSYNPLTLTNAGTPDDFTVSVRPEVLSQGATGSAFTERAIKRTWIVEERTAGGSNATVKLQWDNENELIGFSRTAAYLSQFSAGEWDDSPPLPAQGTNPFTVTRSSITSFSSFAVFSTVVSSVSTTAENPVQLFPNPVKELLYVKLPARYTATTLQVINSKGEVIKTMQAKTGATVATVNTSGLPAGVYSMILTAGKWRETKLFVKR